MMASRIKGECDNEVTEQEELLSDVFKKNGIEGIQTYMKEGLNKWRETELHIAVAGKSGSGKSTFINVIRGLKSGEVGAADTNVEECTMKCQSYTHPKNENIVFWDLPGVGTKEFNRENYKEEVKLAKYDFFLIFSSERFMENDAWLANEVKQMGKKFYFVRTKVDDAITNEPKSRKEPRGRDVILETIRKNCLKHLKEFDLSESFVYLIDNFKTEDFDFIKLQSKLIEDSPQLTRQAIVFSIISKTDDMMLKKKKELEKRIPNISLISAVTSAIPVPVINAAVDLVLMLEEVNFYRDQFGLTQDAINRSAQMLGMSEEELRMDLKMKEILIDYTVKGLMTVCQAIVITEAVEEVAKFMIPILGSAAAGAISYKSTHYWLTKILEGLYQDALEINKKLSDHSVKSSSV
ncbi:T-cell-specific guanine nucleotide triphosphate-binding protein 2-like [Ruditapes philippinarum]|uniref:T-cell-specific guanine nucleotide triphosphate-binding protein 2-like n=1 Tax=Ruditapes philippinarum TaxID=129788 RepID=UPI00295C00A3|nr:T-cell-specific guanine nucleotide triphosphate-binding protein 2-like [Ruditapes philippinarum]